MTEAKIIEHSAPDVMATSPQVSVVMLAYNHGAYIGQAIEGVACQKTTFPVELLIGEDCSPDNTLEVALAYQHKHPDLVRVITAERNVGPRPNSKRLEEAVRGKYVAYCEGDDYWHDPRKLQMQVDYLETHPECGLVYTDADSLDVTSGERAEAVLRYEPERHPGDDAYTSILRGNIEIWPLTVCVRTSLVREILRDCPEVTDASYAMGDTQRYLEITRRSAVHFMSVSTATHNRLAESMTQSRNTDKRARFIASSKRLVLHYLDKYPLPPETDREIRSWVARRSLRHAFICKSSTAAAEEWEALRRVETRPSWRYHLYRHGSRNALAHAIVTVVFNMLAAGAKLKQLACSDGTRH